MSRDVHVVVRHYSTEEGTWQTIMVLCADKADAEARANALIKTNENANAEFYVETHKILQPGQ